MSCRAWVGGVVTAVQCVTETMTSMVFLCAHCTQILHVRMPCAVYKKTFPPFGHSRKHLPSRLDEFHGWPPVDALCRYQHFFPRDNSARTLYCGLQGCSFPRCVTICTCANWSFLWHEFAWSCCVCVRTCLDVWGSRTSVRTLSWNVITRSRCLLVWRGSVSVRVRACKKV